MHPWGNLITLSKFTSPSELYNIAHISSRFVFINDFMSGLTDVNNFISLIVYLVFISEQY